MATTFKNRAYVLDANLILDTNKTIPSSTTATSTNTVDFGGNSLGLVKIVVKAGTTPISVARNATFTIKALFGDTDSPTDDLRVIPYQHKNSAAAEAHPAGSTITEFIIPDSLPDNYRFVKLSYTTDGTCSGTLDAAVVMT